MRGTRCPNRGDLRRQSAAPLGKGLPRGVRVKRKAILFPRLTRGHLGRVSEVHQCLSPAAWSDILLPLRGSTCLRSRDGASMRGHLNEIGFRAVAPRRRDRTDHPRGRLSFSPAVEASRSYAAKRAHLRPPSSCGGNWARASCRVDPPARRIPRAAAGPTGASLPFGRPPRELRHAGARPIARVQTLGSDQGARYGLDTHRASSASPKILSWCGSHRTTLPVRTAMFPR